MLDGIQDGKSHQLPCCAQKFYLGNTKSPTAHPNPHWTEITAVSRWNQPRDGHSPRAPAAKTATTVKMLFITPLERMKPC